MLPLLIPMGIGALGGALMKKKDPLKGALLGAGLGAGAAYAAPAIGGLLGGGAATGAASTGASAAPWVADGVGPQMPGLLSQATSALSQYKPAFDAAATGIQMSGALDEKPQDAPAPVPEQMQGGSQTLATIAAQGAPATVQAGMQERARRRAMLRGGV